MEPNPDYLLLGSGSIVTSLSFARFEKSTTKCLISGMDDGSVVVWKLKTRRIVYRQEGAHDGPVLGVAVILDLSSRNSVTESGDELVVKYIVTQGRDGKIYRWQVEPDGSGWHKMNTLNCQSLNFCRFANISLKGDERNIFFIPSPSNSSAIDLYETTGTMDSPIGNLGPPEKTPKEFGMLMDICTVPSLDHKDRIHVFGGYESGQIVLWVSSLPTANCESSTAEIRHLVAVEKFHPETVTTLDYCRSTNRGYSGSADGTLTSWTVKEDQKTGDTTCNNFKMELKQSKCLESGIGCVRCRPGDGLLVVVGMWDGRVLLLGAKKFKHLATLGIHEDSITTLCFDDTKEFAVGSKDQIISLWSLYRNV